MSISEKTISLSERQKEVLSRLAEGKTTETIAQELKIQKVEVRDAQDKLFMKFAAKNRKHLLEEAVRHGHIPKDAVPAS